MAGENGDETARVICNFCCSNTRYEQTQQEQDNEAVVSMESQLKRLRFLTRRMTGRDLDGLSFPELESLDTRLKHAYEIVKNLKTQVEQEEVERMRNQKKQAANELRTGRGPLVPCSFSEERPQKQDDEAPKPLVLGTERGPLVPCSFSGRGTLVPCSSSEERPQKQDDEAPKPLVLGTERGPLVPCSFSGRGTLVPCSSSGISSEERPQQQDGEAPKPVTALQRAYERRLAEPMESEFERLWLLNERMNGRKLEGMTLYEVLILKGQILDSMHRVKDLMLEPITEHKARQRKEESINLLAEQERCLLDNVKDEDRNHDIGLGFRPRRHRRLSVSRKIKKSRKT